MQNFAIFKGEIVQLQYFQRKKELNVGIFKGKGVELRHFHGEQNGISVLSKARSTERWYFQRLTAIFKGSPLFSKAHRHFQRLTAIFKGSLLFPKANRHFQRLTAIFRPKKSEIWHFKGPKAERWDFQRGVMQDSGTSSQAWQRGRRVSAWCRPQ